MERRIPDSSRLTAVLGPTNTGKTHLAVERMLSARTGMMGFPLRLLAREIYDRVVRLKGEGAAALITGEEKRVPPNARYFLCTVEAMPLDLQTEFLAIDEIQLAADRERGHVFTDRLLHARGTRETMFLGAEAIRPRIRQLVPDAEYIVRPRFSELRYLGPKRLSRLPPRSAVIAFSAEEVYAMAEAMRGTRGGCAVVLGALSPRTRNAQVALYQAGEVDYLVATDAIGMGLNMDLDCVWFSAARKFDGHTPRPLTAAEIAQIAGRAGRYLRNGGFGVTGVLEGLDPELVEAVEAHRFPTIKTLYWRNAELDFRSLDALLRSLDRLPEAPGLRRKHDADDHMTLLALSRDPEVAALARSRPMVALLWDACQIPDFRKTLADAHVRLVKDIFTRLAHQGQLPNDWVGTHIARLDRTDGDIDTLTSRISHIRTWTYIAYRPGWTDDSRGWQERTRAIEDRLSDALHERLTQRFVDRRAAALHRESRTQDGARATVQSNGEVVIGGHSVGRLEGFRFAPERQEGRGAETVILPGTSRALGLEIARRLDQLERDEPAAVSLALDEKEPAKLGTLTWRGAPVAKLIAGDSVLKPRLRLIGVDLMDSAQKERLRRRLASWLGAHLERFQAPLAKLDGIEASPAVRGLAFQLAESLGLLPRRAVASLCSALNAADRATLKAHGVRLGRLAVYVQPMLVKQRGLLRALLLSIAHGNETPPFLPGRAEVSVACDPALPEAYYAALGFVPVGPRAFRVDIAERLVALLKRRAKAGPFALDAEISALSGCPRREMVAVLEALGFVASAADPAAALFAEAPRRTKAAPHRARGRARQPAVDPHSPFAKLAALRPPGAAR
ncbi:MAG: helicase-related protein [Alphaproteobacteria bacterium]